MQDWPKWGESGSARDTFICYWDFLNSAEMEFISFLFPHSMPNYRKLDLVQITEYSYLKFS
jgi:hypothetical protein